VPYRTGWWIDAVHARDEGLLVHCRDTRGHQVEHVVRHLALHDGLQPNSVGLPQPSARPVWSVRAGDCREVLGAQAAVIDGCEAARAVAAHLGLLPADASATLAARLDVGLRRARRTQAAVRQLLGGGAPPMAGDPVICRCEGLRKSDLQALAGQCTLKELRLYGRFGMGACQGRFCQRAVAQLCHEAAGEAPDTGDTGVPRWPLRPVSISAMAAYVPPEP